MFLLKDTLNKANTCLCISKLHFTDRAIQKHGQDVDPGISVKLELADLKKNGKASGNQILKFKRDLLWNIRFGVSDFIGSFWRVLVNQKSDCTKDSLQPCESQQCCAEDMEICSNISHSVKHARERYSTYLQEQE